MRHSTSCYICLICLFETLCLSTTYAQSDKALLRVETKKLKLESFDWVRLALNLSGDTDAISKKAHEELLKIPNIDALLKKEINGPFRALALDVVAQLERKTLVPELLELATRDEDGFIYQTLNPLIDPSNRDLIVDTYLMRLNDFTSPVRAAAPAKITMLDTLTRLGIPVSNELLSKLLNDESFELRLFAQRNLQYALRDAKKNDYLKLLESSLKASPYQLRLASIFTWQALNETQKKKSSHILNTCLRDKNSVVQDQCKLALEQENTGGHKQ